ncbi:hypothetical protein MRX96_050130 [Rhipicephalus microplus]
MTMEVTVNGRDADQEELESSDWVTKVSKRVAELQESQQRERDGATRTASISSGCVKEGRMMPAGFNGDKHGVSGRPSYKAAGKKLAERSVASHLPRLPNADHKVIIRPKEGLMLTRHSAPVIGGAEKPGVSHKAPHDGGDCAQEKSKSTGPQCTISLTIGHRANVCPTAHEFTSCETCDHQFPTGQQPGRTAHECEVKCFNCEGPHGARDPRCPKKQQADNLARIATEKGRLKTTPTDATEPQKSQASQGRLTKPAKKYDQNYPLLLLQNQFSALQDSTPDPRPEPRPRSGSLPGHTTKRPTPPPPSPKPKTPSYLQALLSQKPPTPSEGPPRKQPRQSPSDKVSPSFTPLGRSVTKQHKTSTHSSTPISSSAATQVSAAPHYFLAYKTENDMRLETTERKLNLLQKQQDEIQTQQAVILKQLAALAQSLELLRNAATTRRRGTARDDAHPYKFTNHNNGGVE